LERCATIVVSGVVHPSIVNSNDGLLIKFVPSWGKITDQLPSFGDSSIPVIGVGTRWYMLFIFNKP